MNKMANENFLNNIILLKLNFEISEKYIFAENKHCKIASFFDTKRSQIGQLIAVFGKSDFNKYFYE